jgi:hypothetical protein
MNVHMQNITLTGRDGKVSKLEYVYIRGSKMRFMILPDMLKARAIKAGWMGGGAGVLWHSRVVWVYLSYKHTHGLSSCFFRLSCGVAECTNVQEIRPQGQVKSSTGTRCALLTHGD